MSNPYDLLVTTVRATWETDDRLTGEALTAAQQGLLRTVLMLTGSPEGTVLRNKNTGETVERAVVNGVALWRGLGGKQNYLEPVLLPEDDWKCIYNSADET